MKQIYKRQPRQYNLPNNYDDLDAVNYHNLNGFKGLQVYDNPLVADANSTYDCKNVYVDEHGNLTVRPALTPNVEDTGVLWKHVFSDEKELTITEGLILNTWVTTKTLQGLSVVPFETNDKKYIFLQDETRDTLYDITDGNFTIVEGVVLLDDPENPDISHYNILNSKVLFEYSAQLPATRSETNYSELAKVIVGSLPKSSGIYPIDTNNVLVIEKTQIRWFERLYSSWNETVIQLPFDTNTLPDWDFYPDLIQDDYRYSAFYSRYNNIKRLVIPNADRSVTIVECSAVQTASGIRTMFDTGTVYARMYTVSPNSVISKTSTYSHEYSGLAAIAPTSDGFVALTYSENLGVDEFAKLSLSRCDMNTNRIIVDDIRQSVNPEVYPVFLHLACDTENVYFSRLSISSANAIQQQSWTYDGSVNTSLTTQYVGDILGIFAESGATIPVMLYVTPNNIDLMLTDLWSEMLQNINLPNFYTSRTTFKLAIVSSNISITAMGSDGLYTGYELYNDTLVKYTPSYNLINMLDGEIVFDADTNLIYRQKLLQSKILERDQSIIPVLSNINEPVVTGFFLDNCWWFITEHSIFGTGVDGNGIQTPERFDPLKYFKVSEKITGAIRISDTSFWVFHNNGAYLIYKTSLALAEGTEYRWLYTATAKSKGCDFENALHTLSVTSNIVTVTASDICNAVLRENVQSDERTLVPMTTQFAVLMRELLAKTESVKIFDYRYLTVFCLNPAIPNGTVPAVVYDNVSASWWYWEFPVNKVVSVRELEDYTVLYCEVDGKYIALKLTDDEYYYHLGTLEYEVYADRLNVESQEFTQIEWYWQSAVQVFNTIERRKQLLFTTFVFDDYAPSEYAEQEIEIGYFFDIYSRDYITSTPDETTVPVYRITNRACRTTIGSFNYLQLNLQNRDFESTNFEVLTKPKICCISMKYRILRGEL